MANFNLVCLLTSFDGVKFKFVLFALFDGLLCEARFRFVFA
jgi:hypothetical protein